jgi:hypothetical protein
MLGYGGAVSPDEYASPAEQFPEWDLLPAGGSASASRREAVWAEVARRHPRRFRAAVRAMRWLSDTYSDLDRKM